MKDLKMSSRLKIFTKSITISILIFVMFGLSITNESYAVQEVYPEYSLNDLYKAAIEKSEIIEISKEDVLISEIQKKKAISSFVPNLLSYGDYRRYSEIKRASFGDFVLQPEDVYSWGARLQQSFSLGGREFIALNMTKKGIEKSKEDFATVNENYLLNVALAYYDVLKSQKNLDIAKDNFKRLEKHKNTAKIRYQVGEITKTVILRAEAEVSQAQSEVVKATNRLKVAKANLAKLTGIEKSFTIIEKSFKSESIEELTALQGYAIENRTELKSLDIQKQIVKDQITLAKSSYLPDVTFEAAYSSNHMSPAASFNNKNVMYGQVSLNFPVFEGGQRKADVNQAKARLRQSELLYKDFEDTINLEVEDAYYNLITQESIIGKIQDQVMLAKDNYNNVSEQFKEGFANNIDVVDANNFLFSSEQQLSNAQFDYQEAVIMLKKATGIFLMEVQGSLKAQNEGEDKL
jgi:outer membrane protein